MAPALPPYVDVIVEVPDEASELLARRAPHQFLVSSYLILIFRFDFLSDLFQYTYVGHGHGGATTLCGWDPVQGRSPAANRNSNDLRQGR